MIDQSWGAGHPDWFTKLPFHLFEFVHMQRVLNTTTAIATVIGIAIGAGALYLGILQFDMLKRQSPQKIEVFRKSLEAISELRAQQWKVLERSIWLKQNAVMVGVVPDLFLEMSLENSVNGLKQSIEELQEIYIRQETFLPIEWRENYIRNITSVLWNPAVANDFINRSPKNPNEFPHYAPYVSYPSPPLRQSFSEFLDTEIGIPTQCLYSLDYIGAGILPWKEQIEVVLSDCEDIVVRVEILIDRYNSIFDGMIESALQ